MGIPPLLAWSLWVQRFLPPGAPPCRRLDEQGQSRIRFVFFWLAALCHRASGTGRLIGSLARRVSYWLLPAALITWLAHAHRTGKPGNKMQRFSGVWALTLLAEVRRRRFNPWQLMAVSQPLALQRPPRTTWSFTHWITPAENWTKATGRAAEQRRGGGCWWITNAEPVRVLQDNGAEPFFGRADVNGQPLMAWRLRARCDQTNNIASRELLLVALPFHAHLPLRSGSPRRWEQAWPRVITGEVNRKPNSSQQWNHREAS